MRVESCESRSTDEHLHHPPSIPKQGVMFLRPADRVCAWWPGDGHHQDCQRAQGCPLGGHPDDARHRRRDRLGPANYHGATVGPRFLRRCPACLGELRILGGETSVVIPVPC